MIDSEGSVNYPKFEKSISQILADLGVTHESCGDAFAHRLYFADRFIGYYDARQIAELIRQHLPEEAE
jgi:hypothetical protein